jgi:hypothetical protein
MGFRIAFEVAGFRQIGHLDETFITVAQHTGWDSEADLR